MPQANFLLLALLAINFINDLKLEYGQKPAHKHSLLYKRQYLCPTHNKLIRGRGLCMVSFSLKIYKSVKYMFMRETKFRLYPPPHPKHTPLSQIFELQRYFSFYSCEFAKARCTIYLANIDHGHHHATEQQLAVSHTGACGTQTTVAVVMTTNGGSGMTTVTTDVPTTTTSGGSTVTGAAGSTNAVVTGASQGTLVYYLR